MNAAPRARNRSVRRQRPVGSPVAVAAVIAGLATTLAACAPQARVVGGGSGPVLGAPVKIAPGSVDASFTVVGDASQILRESAQDSLEAAGMTCPGSSAGCATVDLSARLTQPSAGFSGVRPPIRIVELIARYHPAGASGSSSTVSYQRTVATEGNLSTATWMRISDALMTDFASDFSFRSRAHGIVVRLPSWATGQTTLPRTSSPKAFHVVITGDGRSNDDTIGNVGGREVRLARRATDYIAEMLTDELRGAGHLLVAARDGRLVGSQLEKFWISTVQDGLGWKTQADIEVSLEVSPPPGVKRKKAERHRCTASEHTGRTPSEPDLSRILLRCLSDLATSMRNDSAWSLGQG